MTALRNNVIANVLGQLWKAVMAFAFIPVLVRELGTESYGLIGIYASLQAWLLLVDMGLRPTLVREMAKLTAREHTPDSIRDLLRSAEILAAIACLFVALGFWVASSWLAVHWLNAPTLPQATVATALAMMGGVAALQVIESLYSGSIGGTERQILQNLLSSFTAFLRGAGGAVVVTYFSTDIRSFFEWQALVAVIGVTITGASLYFILPPKTRPARFSVEALHKVRAYAGGMILITVLVLLLTQIDKLILAKLLPLDVFGRYMLATAVASALFYIYSPIVAAFFPRLIRLAADDGERQELRNTYHTACQLVTVTVGSGGIALSVLAVPIMRVWTNDPSLAAEVGPLVSLLAIGFLFNGLMVMPYHLQLAYGWTTLTIKINAAATVILSAAILYFVPLYGVIAAATIWCVLNFGYVTVGVWLMHRRLLLEDKWTWYLKDTLLPLGGMTLTCLLLAPFLQDSSRLGTLFGIAVISAITFSVGILLGGRVKKMVFASLARVSS